MSALIGFLLPIKLHVYKLEYISPNLHILIYTKKYNENPIEINIKRTIYSNKFSCTQLDI
jgi:hypothetical protein